MAALWRDAARPPVAAGRARAPGANPKRRHRAWPIPADLRRAPLGRGRVLFVGDAAGATDPLTGEGIAQALLTGVLAAEAIAAAGTGAADVGRRATTAAVGATSAADLRFAAAAGRGPGPAPRRPGGARGRRPDRLDPAQLRPLAVRGLSPGPGPHARPVAPSRADAASRSIPLERQRNLPKRFGKR